MNFIPDDNPIELTELTNEFKTNSIMLMFRFLQNLPAETRAILIRLQEQKDWRAGLELTIDKHDQGSICMVMISQEGERKVIATIAEGSPQNAH
ncbi:MAG: hypothetical protein JWM78_621 [Verrucomicrobiaceae bacterium]|nr:hypothetical protein [Verrucomicrobiaceae bacterium]